MPTLNQANTTCTRAQHSVPPENCGLCQECIEHACSCTMCRGCGIKYRPEELCPECSYCAESCCACIACSGCGTTLTLPDNDESVPKYCTSCTRCFTCCACSVCITCNENFAARRPEFCYHCKKCVVHCVEMQCFTEHKTSRSGHCSRCNGCKTHCICRECGACGRRFPGTDSLAGSYFHVTSPSVTGGIVEGCGLCTGCCICNASGVPFRKGKFTMYHSVFAKGQFKRNPMRRHISVEIEVDAFDAYSSKQLNTVLNKWKDPVVSDGSLHNGFEINTNPCNGDVYLDHMKDLCDGLAAMSAGCTVSCGLHVHVNVKGTPLIKNDGTPITRHGEQVYDPRSAYTHYDLRRLIMLYYLVEPAIYGLVAPQRLESRYAKPCGKFYMTNKTTPKDFRKEQVVKLYREGRPLPERVLTNGGVVKRTRKIVSWDSRGEPVYKLVSETTTPNNTFKQTGTAITTSKAAKYQAVRYYALNLHSFFVRGTVEFRHKEGTVDYNEIVNWSLICAQVVDQASKMTEQQIKELPIEPRAALLAILTPELKQYAERKWAVQDETIPRFQQMIAARWGMERPVQQEGAR